MASGNTLLLLTPAASTPPGTVYATLGVIVGASSPTEAFQTLEFDDTTVEYADFHGLQMPSSYAGGGVTLTFQSAAAANTNTYVLSAAFRKIDDDAEDLDTTAFTYDYNNTGAITAPSVVGETTEDTLTFTDGADMDSVAAGNFFSLRVRRVPTDGSDTLTGDVRILSIAIKET